MNISITVFEILIKTGEKPQSGFFRGKTGGEFRNVENTQNGQILK